jgi:hypothetical protein
MLMQGMREEEVILAGAVDEVDIVCNIPATPGLAIVTSDSYLGS